MGINFNKVKRLAFKIKSEVPDNFKENDLFDIFNLNQIENNLTTLVIDAKLNIKSDIFENINIVCIGEVPQRGWKPPPPLF